MELLRAKFRKRRDDCSYGPLRRCHGNATNFCVFNGVRGVRSVRWVYVLTKSRRTGKDVWCLTGFLIYHSELTCTWWFHWKYHEIFLVYNSISSLTKYKSYLTGTNQTTSSAIHPSLLELPPPAPTILCPYSDTDPPVSRYITFCPPLYLITYPRTFQPHKYPMADPPEQQPTAQEGVNTPAPTSTGNKR